MASPYELCPRGPWNELLDAAHEGYCDRVFGLVAAGRFDINQGSSKGYTALMLASDGGFCAIVRFLLNHGAIVTAMADNGVTALHVAVKQNFVSVATMLLAAGADVGASCPNSLKMTPLHLAAHLGNCEVMEVLVRAKADVDVRLTDGATAMYLAAEAGMLRAVEILLRHGANACIGTTKGATPLYVAVEKCHTDIVRRIVERVSAEKFEGFQTSAPVLRLAGQRGHIEIMSILYAAGFKDKDGAVLCTAIMSGGARAVKFLLERPCYADGRYANSCRGAVGKPLLCCLTVSSVTASSSRIMRMLIDAGADTSFTFACLDDDGGFLNFSTLLQLVTQLTVDGKSGDVVFDQEQVCGMQGMRRLLLQVDAARAVSWGWTRATTEKAAEIQPAVDGPPFAVVIRWERAAATSRVVQKALFR